MTVPLVLALGLGVVDSNENNNSGGFGILACASFCPIMSVLLCGLLLDCGRGFGTPAGYTSTTSDPPMPSFELKTKVVTVQDI